MSPRSPILTPSVPLDSDPSEEVQPLRLQSFLSKPGAYPTMEQSRLITRNTSMNTHITKQVRVYIVDPHEIVRVGLRALLDPDPEFKVVGGKRPHKQ